MDDKLQISSTTAIIEFCRQLVHCRQLTLIRKHQLKGADQKKGSNCINILIQVKRS